MRPQDGERRAECALQEVGPPTSGSAGSGPAAAAASLELLVLLEDLDAKKQLDAFGLYL